MNYRKTTALRMLFLAVLVGVVVVAKWNITAAATFIVGDRLTCAGATHSSIQSAVNAAASGDTIVVCPGQFSQTVTINKTLTLRGAQHGVDARTRSVALERESVVSGALGGFNILAGNVVIDGFKITGASGPGVKLGPGSYGGVQVLNSIISDNTLGLYFNDKTNGAVVRFNLIDSNNRAGTNSAMGIYGDMATDSLVVDRNKFTGQTVAAIRFNNSGQVSTNITNNQFISDSSIILSRVTGPTISGNTITGANSDAIRFMQGVDGARLSCNTIENSAGSALRLEGVDVSTNLHFKDNNIQGNLFGLRLDTGAYNTAGGRLDARSNSWGSATGPDLVQGGNPGGTGDKLDDPDGIVDYAAFRTAPIADADGDGVIDSCYLDDVRPVPPPGPTIVPAFIYGIDSQGHLQWYRHDGARTGIGFQTPGSWQGARNVGRGWEEVTHVFPGGGNIIYATTADGTLKWYQHNGFNTGSGLEDPKSWGASRNVGRGWSGFVDVFSAGDGVIYVIQPDGTLKWHRHLAYRTGQGLETPGAWANSRNVGRGWTGYKHVFSGGDGVIYVIASDGTLKWYRHKAYLTGEGLETPGAWEGPKTVGRGWEDVQQVFSPGGGIIYAVMPDGTLRWFKHVGYLDGRGLESAGAWIGPKDVGRGWNDLTNVFALLPGTPAIVK
jgi:hypothetical protein